MRYTRYDYKRKKGNNIFVWLIVIIVLSVFIGFGIFKLLFVGNEGEVNIPTNDIISDNTQKKVDNSKNKSFGIIQCGLFSSKEAAESAISGLPSSFPTFIVEDEGKFKVMAGIYSGELLDSKMDELKNSSVNNFRIKCDIKLATQEKKAMSEIIESYLNIINQLYGQGVKGIDITKFKKWVNDDAKSKVKNTDEDLNKLLENINSLPDEIDKSIGEESVKFLYNMLIKYKS